MKKIFSILSILLTIILILAVYISASYSIWQSKFTQTESNIIKTDCLNMTVTEISGLTVNTSSPMSDSSGLRQKPYEITIENKCNLDSSLNITAQINKTSNISSSLIKLSYKIEGDDYSSPKEIDKYQKVTTTDSNVKESYSIIEDVISAHQKKKYTINVWLSASATNTSMKKNYSMYFELNNQVVKMYRDKSNASTPDIIDGLTPVYFDGGKIYTANVVEKWYDYDSHEWANAVILNSINKAKYYDEDNDLIAHKEVNINDISQMYVWIPRYKYQLFNINKDGMQTINEQMINIEFVDNTIVNNKFKAESQYQNGEWYVHPAFTFGEKELNGIWVGKFETSGTTSNPIILPNQQSITNTNVSTMFTTSLNIKNQQNLPSYSDSHMMKNTEWGAIAYLTNSKYGLYINATSCLNAECEVWINNVNTGTGVADSGVQYASTITGCSGSSYTASLKSNMTACQSGRTWDKEGIKASTTQNMYGIYDMAGGTWDYVAGVIIKPSTSSLTTANMYVGSSGFTEPYKYESKYFDLYNYSTEYLDFGRSHLGDGIREVIKTLNVNAGAWNTDFARLPYSTNSWVARGGYHNHKANTGIFSLGRSSGQSLEYASFRVILVSEK